MNRFIFINFIFFMLILTACSKSDKKEVQNTVSEDIVQSEYISESDTTVEQIEPCDIKSEFIQENLKLLTLEQKIGQMFMIAVRHDMNGNPVLNFDENILNIINKYNPGGFIMFQENIDTVEQTQNFIYDLQSNSYINMFIGIDEEGGVVSRLQKSGKMGATKFPASLTVGNRGDIQLAYELGTAIGSEISALGFNMDFAPVADVNTNPKNQVMGNRVFGSDVNLVADMVVAEASGIQSQNVISVIKHFPGLGDTYVDTHLDSSYVESDLDRLNQIEFVPFEAAIQNGIDAIMVSHLSVPNVTSNDIPSSLSKKMITDILRDELEFEGLIITDALNMAAISQNYSSAEAAKMAIEAGVDILLMPDNIDEAFNSVLDAVKSGEISQTKIEESVIRILSIKYDREILNDFSINPNANDILGSHKNIVQDITR